MTPPNHDHDPKPNPLDALRQEVAQLRALVDELQLQLSESNNSFPSRVLRVIGKPPHDINALENTITGLGANFLLRFNELQQQNDALDILLRTLVGALVYRGNVPADWMVAALRQAEVDARKFNAPDHVIVALREFATDTAASFEEANRKVQEGKQ
jgi:hypothetical protein